MKRLLLLPFLLLALSCDSNQTITAPDDLSLAMGPTQNVIASATGGFEVDHGAGNPPALDPCKGTGCPGPFRTNVNALAKADGSFDGWLKGTVYNGFGNPYREIPVFCVKTFAGGEGSPHACPLGATCAEVWGILPPGESTFPNRWESYAIMVEDYGEGANAVTDEASRIEIESRTISESIAKSQTTGWCQDDDFFIPPTGGARLEDTDPILGGNVKVRVN